MIRAECWNLPCGVDVSIKVSVISPSSQWLPERTQPHSYALNLYWLVVLTILKNMKVNGKDYPIIMENKKSLKPPARIVFGFFATFRRLHGTASAISLKYETTPRVRYGAILSRPCPTHL